MGAPYIYIYDISHLRVKYFSMDVGTLLIGHWQRVEVFFVA